MKFKTMQNYITLLFVSVLFIFLACSDDDETSTLVSVVDLGISPASNADARSSYSNTKTDVHVSYFGLPSDVGSGNLRDAIGYLDANGDGFTDVFVGTGEYLFEGEKTCILAINDGSGNFNYSEAEFGNNMPPATHARKTLISDFNNDDLQDMLVLDHGFDSHPFPGNNPKLIIQNSAGSFGWSKLPNTGFHHGGASGDIDNDGDIDVFVGGDDPFFYINDGNANFEMVVDRFDNSVEVIFSAELFDVDKDGYLDLIVGAEEHTGQVTTLFWGSSTGSYSRSLKFEIPSVNNYGIVLDFEAEDIDDDGDKDLIINRTGGGNNNNYVGRTLQLLSNNGNREFTDVTSNIDDPGTESDDWITWIRAQDIDNDGDIDFFPDDLAFGFTYINDGNGHFTKTQ